jgi:hypothetical protein
MTDEKQVSETLAPVDEKASPQETPQQTDDAPKKSLNLRETIIAAKREAESKAEPEPKPEKEPKAEKPGIPDDKAVGATKAKEVREPEEKTVPREADKPKEEESRSKDSGDKTDADKTQSSSKPPTSWSKNSRAEWDSLSPSVQSEVLRREADTARGVEELKKRHNDELTAWKSRQADLEEAMRPYETAIQQSGQTKGQVVKSLLDWNMALVGPRKLDAFRALAQSFGVDISQLSGGSAAQTQQGATATESQSSVPSQGHDRSWEPAIRSVAQRLEQFEQSSAVQRQATAEQVVHNWAKDKTHFERVRGLMAQLVDNDAKMGGVRFLKNGQIDMDAAYDAAIWADPDVRADLLSEQKVLHEAAVRSTAEKAKADADTRILAEKQRADAERARRAAVSLRPGAPISGTNGAALGSIPQRESVRDSIKRALSGI